MKKKRAKPDAVPQAWFRSADLCERWGVTKPTVWSWWAVKKILPPPVRLGPNTCAWALETILNFERARARAA